MSQPSDLDNSAPWQTHPIFEVNAKFFASDGERFDIVAEPDFVSAGFAINVQVLLRLPDGTLRPGTRILFTANGLGYLLQEQMQRAASGPLQ